MNLPYFTPAERTAPMSHYAEGFMFRCAALDLSKPVTVMPTQSTSDFADPVLIAKAVTNFMTWWLLDIRPRLNGFSGTDTINWVFTELVVTSE